MLTVTLDHPDYPDDFEMGIVGLGLFKNREGREVTEEQEKAFVSFYRMEAKEKLEQSDMITVSGTAAVTDLEDVLGVDISDRPSLDPTAMNLDPETGEVFEFANLSGASTDPDDTAELEVEEETTTTTTTTSTPTTSNTTADTGGGE